jgi:hypothetical protein
MLKRAFRPFETHRSYKAKKSAVAAVEVVAVVAGGGGLGDVPFRTTSGRRVGDGGALQCELLSLV